MILVSRNIRTCGYSLGFPGEGASKDYCVCREQVQLNSRSRCLDLCEVWVVKLVAIDRRSVPASVAMYLHHQRLMLHQTPGIRLQ